MRAILIALGAAYMAVGIAFFLSSLPVVWIVTRNAVLFARRDPKPCSACGEKHLHTWGEAILEIFDMLGRVILNSLLWPWSIYTVVKSND
jgi:hypothetical protein